MELQERLAHLETIHDWQGLVEELEKGIASGGANEVRASYHLRLGRVLESKFLSGVKALKHFQDAYKLNPALAESLESARAIYSTAQLKDHWRNRAKKKPPASEETGGCHEHTEIPNAEDSA